MPFPDRNAGQRERSGKIRKTNCAAEGKRQFRATGIPRRAERSQPGRSSKNQRNAVRIDLKKTRPSQKSIETASLLFFDESRTISRLILFLDQKTERKGAL
ncbi:hypothetical protein RAH42_11010 [Pyramidobacter sp. YE332]|uniref:hypothetical protein n=1 Tax=unclassified Pyramidobacter TaxID=2632171 RepID=UPI00143A2F29|nr:MULTISPECIES: hypothetical protein [unclassified Pyramidobacter]WOL39652.1 hypothetical protein RAH42_11010 [Pyramidobacter sp. YE332]